MFNELDDGYKTAVNGNMCNDICLCPGKPGDKHYDEYKAIPAETLAKYFRTWDPLDQSNKLLYFADGDVAKEELTTNTVKECIENTDKILDKIADFKVQQAELAASQESTPRILTLQEKNDIRATSK